MDFFLSSKFWFGVLVLGTLLHYSPKLSANERPWLSYFINPSFWFSGEVDKEKSDSYYYSYNRKQIRFSPMGNWFELGNSLIEQADVASFEVLGRNFAKDKNHIYFKSDVISNQVDHASFEVLDGNLVRDKNHVYVPKDDMPNDKVQSMPKQSLLYALKEAEPARFKVIDDAWSTDGNNLYYYFVKQAIDVSSFIKHNDFIVSDSSAIFIKKEDDFIDTNISGAGVQSLDEHFVFDKTHIHWYEAEFEHLDGGVATSTVWLESMPYRDINSFERFSESHFALDEAVYWHKHEIIGAEQKSFQLINQLGYAKDKNSVFYKQFMLANAQPQSFSILGEYSSYSRDNQSVYYKQHLVGAKQTPVRVLTHDVYLVNGGSVYFKGKKIEGANGQMFELMERFALYGNDGNSIYFEDQKLDGVDLATAEVVIRDLLLKDKQNVYWKAKQVEGADVKTFTRSHADYAKYDAEDKHYYYKDGIRVTKK